MELVIARYNEDTRWLEHFGSLKTTVYNKSGNGPNPLPNIGRESHTYLHHICSNYEKLPEITIFLQGNPYDHVPDLHDRIWELDSTVTFRDLSSHIFAEDCQGNPVHPGLRVDEMYQALFGSAGPSHFACHSGACFAVSRECIAARPKSFYENALRLVVDRKQGPWEIERIWASIFSSCPESSINEGVVTAADAGFFRDLQLMIRSLVKFSKYPLVVYDLGLEPSQREWILERDGVSIHQLPNIYKPAQQIIGSHWWQSWIKPFFVFNSPFDRTLWIDADCVIISDLAEAFQIIASKPLVVRDATSAVTENHKSLYEFLPLADNNVDTRGINLNAGVVGLCKIRDRDLIAAWCYGVMWAALNPDKRQLSAFVDQGILLWAFLKLQKTQHIRSDLHWNHPAEASTGLLQSSIKAGQSILTYLQQKYTGVGILHCLGNQKLATSLANELESIFADD